jgi:hypothetical protein
MRSRAICTHTNLLVLGLSSERSLPAPRRSLKGFPHVLLKIAEVNVGLEAVQLDQLPVVDSLKLMQDESVYNANGKNDASPLTSYVDNQIMPQFENSTETNPALEKPGQESPPQESECKRTG